MPPVAHPSPPAAARVRVHTGAAAPGRRAGRAGTVLRGEAR
ncbi:hypothetical protein [Streptomyces somaliensis]|nr:hypothetical protein [Streptomyces somaliensis]